MQARWRVGTSAARGAQHATLTRICGAPIPARSRQLSPGGRAARREELVLSWPLSVPCCVTSQGAMATIDDGGQRAACTAVYSIGVAPWGLFGGGGPSSLSSPFCHVHLRAMCTSRTRVLHESVGRRGRRPTPASVRQAHARTRSGPCSQRRSCVNVSGKSSWR